MAQTDGFHEAVVGEDRSASAPRARHSPASRDGGGLTGLLNGGVMKAVLVVVTVVGLVLATRDPSPPPATAPAPAADNEPQSVGSSAKAMTAVVRVANGKGVAGAAGEATEALRAAGWTAEVPINAPLTDSSVVYFVDGFEGDARSVAQVLGIRRSELVGSTPPGEMAGVQVLVILGART